MAINAVLQSESCLNTKTYLALCYTMAELQIRGGIEDKGNFSYFSMKTYGVAPHETALMMGHKICFMEKYG